jgi:hypothetical protein
MGRIGFFISVIIDLLDKGLVARFGRRSINITRG